MNVLEVANYSAPYAGNFLLSLGNLESKLDDGVMVYVFPAETKKKSYVENMKHVYYLKGKLIPDTLLIRKIIKDYNIQVIHTHFTSSLQNLMVLINVMFNRSIRYIKHEHGEIKKINGYKGIIRNLLRSRVNLFVPCNYPIVQQLVSDGVPAEKIITITNAIDFLRLDNYEQVKKESGIQVLLFGSDWYRKGGEIAIKALIRIPNVKLNIVLSFGLEYVKERIKIDFGQIPEFINFLPPRNDVATYYRMADLFISPSRSEGLPYSVVEAMYCETMTVVSDIPPQQNLVPSEFMFKSEDVDDLENKVRFALHYANKKELGEKLRHTAIELFNIDSWSSKILQLYKTGHLK